MKRFIQLNEEVTNIGQKLQGCFIELVEVKIENVFNNEAFYNLRCYKSKDSYLENIKFNIKIDEVKSFIAEFSDSFYIGEFSLDKYVEEVVIYLCEKNVNFEKENIIIE